MNKLIFLSFILCIPFFSFSQTEFDKGLSAISADLSEKLKAIDKKKIVVLYVADINKAQTTTGKYLADAVSVDIVNNPGGFQVFDRENLDAITGAKTLIAEGYIDAAKARQLGQLLSVDVIVVGTYTVLSNSVRLTLKALDAGSGFVIAASARDLPLDADARALLFNGNTMPNYGGGNSNPNNNPDNNSRAQEQQSVKPNLPTTGTIAINNRTVATLVILLSTETVEPANFGKKYFELTVATNSSDNYEGIVPGEYYLCAVFNRNDFRGCVFSKRIIVQAGKIATININSLTY